MLFNSARYTPKCQIELICQKKKKQVVALEILSAQIKKMSQTNCNGNHTIIWICPSVCPFRISSAVSGWIATKVGRKVRDGPCSLITPNGGSILYAWESRWKPHWQGASRWNTYFHCFTLNYWFAQKLHWSKDAVYNSFNWMSVSIETNHKKNLWRYLWLVYNKLLENIKSRSTASVRLFVYTSWLQTHRQNSRIGNDHTHNTMCPE